VVLNDVFERFVKQSPLAVMARLTMQRALSPQWIDDLFEQHRHRQYTRELLFSTVVDLMTLVVLGQRPSLHAAAQARGELAVSIAALYDKVNHTEPELVRALVQGSAERLAPLVRPMRKQQASWAGGYQVRIVDGSHLPASEKRLRPLRGFRGAVLPGQSLVVYLPEEDLVVDMVPGEDAHAQERTLMGHVLARAQPGELWLADRNFSTTGIFFALHDKGAAFIIREHGVSPNPTAVGELQEVGRVETGTVFEQAVQIEDEAGRQLRLRRIVLHLDQPTEDGDTVIRLLTNAPVERLGAQEVARLYRHRWRIEGMFGRLEAVLNSEIGTLGNPRAALLAFGVAVMAYNVLAVLQAAIEAEHQMQASEFQISSYYIADEVRASYTGMMIALPAPFWEKLDEQSDAQLSHTLLQVAARVNPKKLRKHPRAPKKKTKKDYVPREVASKHVSTARVLQGKESTR
jgi:IS4 transposase